MDKSQLFDEIFSGVWLWSLFFGLTSGGLPIINQREHFGISRGMLIPIEIMIAAGLMIVIGLAQKFSTKNSTPSANQLRPMEISKKWGCLAATIMIDIAYAVCLLYFYGYPGELPWMWMGVSFFMLLILLFAVFRMYFVKDPG